MVLILTACVNELEVDNTALEQRNEIMAFLENIKEKQLTFASAGSSANQTVEKLDELIQSIDYASTEEKILKGNRKVLLVNIKNLSTIPTAKKLKLILYLNDMDIVRGKIVSFDEVGKVDHNKIIELLLNRHSHTFTGQLSTYTLSQKFLTSASFEEGVIRSSSRVSKHKDLPNGGRLDECIDYYLVTTYYNSSGMVTGQNWRFLVRECDDNPCDDPYEDSRMDCGGSGGGSQTSGFPTNPVNGAQFVVIGESEEEIHWLYTCDAAGCSWSVIYKVLPMLVVATQPENYEKLQGIQPVHGQSVYNDDGFLYTYNWFDDTWEGESLSSLADEWEDEKITLSEAFRNDPCLMELWSKISESGEAFRLLSAFLQEYPNAELRIGALYTAMDAFNAGVSGSMGAYGISQNYYQEQYVYLNLYQMPNASNIFLITILGHELIHASMMEDIYNNTTLIQDNAYSQEDLQNNFPLMYDLWVSEGNIEDASHEAMATHYRDQLKIFMREMDILMNGSAVNEDFYDALSWIGLQGTSLYDEKIASGEISANYINQVKNEQLSKGKCN